MLLLTFEGFSPAALSCYGSSWNRTDAIDSLAAIGTTYDRVVTSVTDPLSQLNRWLAADLLRGDLTLISDEQRIGELDAADAIGELILLPPRESGVAESIEDTSLAALVAVAAEQLADNPNVWLHSRFLTRCWDAPRELFPIDDFDDDDFEPLDPSETIEQELAPPRNVRSSVATIFDSWQPPQETIHAGDDPDRIMAWMRTYGCQIRLVDAMVGLLAELACEAGHASIILSGTSGYALGQNGSLGHRTGPLRSCHLHVPMIAAGLSPGDSESSGEQTGEPTGGQADGQTGGLFGACIRDRRVRSADSLPSVAALLNATPHRSPLSPETWAAGQEETEERIETEPREENDEAGQIRLRSHGVLTQHHHRSVAITTDGWFYVASGVHAACDGVDSGSTPDTEDGFGHLFLKPDDLNDANDVARLRPETARNYQAALAE